MRLTSIGQPFDNPEWIFELKYDGFRALAMLRNGRCSLISRNGNVYRSFPALCDELGNLGVEAILDGEVVALDHDGKPLFYDLLRHRERASFVAFDITALNGRDLRELPLVERKRILYATIRTAGRVLVPKHIDGRGVRLFQEVCRRDLEGIVAKWKHGAYVNGDEQPLDRTLRRHARNPRTARMLTWLKIKNPAYTQAEGRGEFLFGKR